MARRVLGLVLLVAVGGVATLWLSRRAVTSPEPGIPLTLAIDRAERVSQLRYELSLTIPETRSAPVRGRITATFRLTGVGAPLYFDFSQSSSHVLSASSNGEPFAAEVDQGHIAVPSSHLAEGDNVVRFDFVAGDEALNRHDDFLYSLFVPARASLTFPCFDQPDLKARWTLTLDVPDGWAAVANGRESERTGQAGRVGLTFDETEPLPTYLVAFAAGRFSVEQAERGGRTLRMFHRETEAEKVTRNREAIFDLHAAALGRLEDYTGIPYPFGKFDFVLIPSFQFRGMEHPGAVYYDADSLLLDESATQNQALVRAGVIAHETSHMWFGDLVTMRWFNDVWMKEVFANFMAAKIVNPSFPSVNHDLRFLFEHYPAAYDVDRTDGSNPIRQDLDNLDQAGTLYGAIIYQKAPIVVRQLERLIGQEILRDGLRQYLKENAFDNADWIDLVAALDERSPVDVREWSRAWIEEPGRPTITTDLQLTDGTITRLGLRQSDPRGRDIVWPERLEVVVALDSGIRSFGATLDQPDIVVDEAAGLPAPQWVLPAGAGLGYGFFDPDARTLDFFSTRLHDIDDAVTRGSALIVLWEAMLEGRTSPRRVLDQLTRSVRVETDELNLQRMLNYVSQIFWRFTTPDDRAAAAASIEPVLRTGLAGASTTTAKAAWFNALRRVATTGETVAWLENLWRQSAAIPGLPLSESDEADLALELAVRDVEGVEEILATQVERFANPDRRDRFRFILPAVSRDEAVRDRFFESLHDPANRAREAWVLDAVRYLHHPLRADQSHKHVRAALDLVRDIQRTGDIFFPKRWTDATLGGYQSAEVAAEVRAFMSGLPADYPERLRWILLSSADSLFRAARFQSDPVL